MPAELDALFDRTQSLARRPRTVLELPGGLTNRNYKVTTPDGVFVARFSAGGSYLLAIDRDCEYRNSVTAAAAGAGPPVAEYRPQDRLLIIGYLDGRTLTPPAAAPPAAACTAAAGSPTTSTCSTSSAATTMWPRRGASASPIGTRTCCR